MDQNLIISLTVGAFVGAASAYLGSIMVLKRMALVGDAFSHVALPGIGIALTYSLNPFLGAFSALALGVLVIWGIERKTSIPTEAVVGLIFAVALAAGILITPAPELLEALFGDISKVKPGDAVLAVTLSALVFLITSSIKDKLILGLLSSDLAKAQGIKIDKLNLIFLAMVAVVVALGVKVVGTLLMGALVIIPAIASKNFTQNLRSYGIFSAILGLSSAVLGIWLANVFNLPPGPIVVLASAAIFVASLIFRK